MRARTPILLGGALTALTVGCAGSLHVRTIEAPDAPFASLHTFRVLPTPPPRDGHARTSAYDPMVDNSIANRALRQTITRAFTDRGYASVGTNPDFVVAVYASAHEKLDVTTWDYGYPYWPRGPWGRRGRVVDQVTTYTEGTVVVDVLYPRTRELMWRGTASATLSEDPVQDLRALQVVAEAVVRKFPHARPTPVVALH